MVDNNNCLFVLPRQHCSIRKRISRQKQSRFLSSNSQLNTKTDSLGSILRIVIFRLSIELKERQLKLLLNRSTWTRQSTKEILNATVRHDRQCTPETCQSIESSIGQNNQINITYLLDEYHQRIDQIDDRIDEKRVSVCEKKNCHITSFM